MADACFAMRKILPPLIIAALMLVAALSVGTSTAAAKAPCWKQLLNDEYDGRIDNTYPIHCYHDALGHLQEDVRTYGYAYNDINRALQAALLGYAKNHNGPPPPNTPVSGQGSGTAKHHRNFFQWVADKIGPGNATSIPLPLLILAGLGLLLVLAAGASYTARRIQARRAQPAPATADPPPRN